MSNFKFYSKEELAKLREIKSIRNCRERMKAFRQFCAEHGRSEQAARTKMGTLRTKNTAQAVTSPLSSSVAISGKTLRLPILNANVDWTTKELIFTLNI